jgi:arylsulfatase A-like enzyme
MGFTKKKGYYEGEVWEWNLPTGSTCPAALECKVSVDRFSGKFKAEHKAYRCYAANAERFPGVRESRWNNFELSRKGEIPDLPKKAKAVRIHASGDFYNQSYFDLWLDYTKARPEIEFWAYTKSLRYWVARLSQIPENLLLTASYGGREDALIEEHSLRWVRVYKKAEDVPENLPIDTCDNWARTRGVNFALVDNFVK